MGLMPDRGHPFAGGMFGFDLDHRMGNSEAVYQQRLHRQAQAVILSVGLYDMGFQRGFVLLHVPQMQVVHVHHAGQVAQRYRIS